MMMTEIKSDSDWDIDWDYTMGMPEDYGYTLYTSTSAEYTEMTDDGVYCYAANTNNYAVRYMPPATCTEGIWEMEITPDIINTSTGIRMQFSDGTGGTQLRGMNNCMVLYDGTSAKYLSKMLVAGTTSTVRLEYSDGTTKVYFDGELISENAYYSTFNTTLTCVYIQGSAAYLKALRFKDLS